MPFSFSATFRRSAKKDQQDRLIDRSSDRRSLFSEQDADHAQRGAAQGKGIARAGGLFANREETRSSASSLSASATAMATLLGRHGIGRDRPACNDRGWRRRRRHLPCRAGRSSGPSRPAAREIRPPRRWSGRPWPGARRVRPSSTSAPILAAISPASLAMRSTRSILGAQLGVEDDALERLDPAFQRVLAVLVPEEFGVRQAGAQHPLIAGDDFLAAVFGDHVGDQGEAVGHLAGLGIAQAEILLMRAHRGLQDFRPAHP